MLRPRPRLLFALCSLWGINLQAQPSEVPWFEGLAEKLSPTYRALLYRERELVGERAGLAEQPVSQQTERVGWHSTFSKGANATKWLQVDLGSSQPFDCVVLVPVEVNEGARAVEGFGFPVRLRVEASDDPGFLEPRLLAALDDADLSNPGNAPLYLATPKGHARFVRVTATRLWSRGDAALLALGEVFIRRGEQNIAAGAAVTVSDAYNNPPAWQPANTTDGQTILGAPVIPVASRRNGWHAQFAKSLDEPKWVQVDLGTELPLDEVRIFPAHPRDFPTRPGFGFPMRFRVEADNDPAFSQPTVLIDHTASDFANPADNPVSMPTRGTTARYVRMTATRLWARSDDFIFALAEMQVWSNGRNVALGQAVTALDSIEISAWSRRLLVDDFNSQGRIVKFTDWLRDLSRRREISIALTQVRRQRERVASDLIVNATRLMVILSLVAGVVCLVSWSRRRRLRRREFNVLRERIAGDLHDEIGSNIGSIVLLSQMALKQPADAPNDLAEINRVARETAASLRDLVWFIQPAASSAGDFAAKLRETAATLLAGVEWTFEGEAPAGTLSLEFKRQLFLILKEALHNVRRHAGASLVQIRLDERAGVFRLEISDDGRGFDVAQNSSGHGLTSLRQRAAALGGTLVLDSTPGSGTRLVLEVKLTSRLRTMSP